MTRTHEAAPLGDGLSAGTWYAEPFREEIAAYPVDEVCVLIEGRLILRSPDGTAQEFGPGEAFAIAKGTPLVWDQPTAVRKFYVIREAAT